MTSSRGGLRLHEQLLLLILRDRKGTVDYRAGFHSLALGGAILAELAMGGQVRIDDDRKARVHAVKGARRTGNDILDEAFQQVRDRERPRGASGWVQRFAGLRRLRHRTARALCRRGVLRADESQLLLIFTRQVYPTVDPGPERRLIKRMREALVGDGEVDAALGVVLSLSHATGSLKIHFGRSELRAAKARLKRIAAGEHLADPDPAHPAAAAQRAVKSAVAAAQAAVSVAISAATTTTVVSS